MTSTRRAPSLQIFQDLPTSFDDFTREHDAPTYSIALYPSSRNFSNKKNVLKPSTADSTVLSPLKRQSPHASPQLQLPNIDLFDSIYFPPPQPSNFSTDSPPKQQTCRSYFQPIAQKPQKALFTMFPTTRSLDKDNFFSSGMFSDDMIHGPDIIHGYGSTLGKRASSNAGPLRDRGNKKQKVEEEEPLELLNPEDMPLLEDNGTKPAYSYATLIGMAILRAPNRRLTLSQIYKWISDSFSFYQTAEVGWMNSIRHNLSLNKVFVKKNRPKDDPGKGSYWTIEEGMEKQFLKDKVLRRNTCSEAPYFHTIQSDGVNSSTAPTIGAFALPPKPVRTIDSSRFSGENEFSSDATIPEADSYFRAEQRDELTMPPPSSRVMRSSPPPAFIQSSPPVARRLSVSGTPPLVSEFPSQTKSGDCKRRVDNFRGRGFFSSIESSATRGPQLGPIQPSSVSQLSSEADHSRSKLNHGRAEEEIARIRGSSYDPSPTKSKATLRKPESYLISSSPLRHFERVRFPALTPGTKLKPPTKAPPTASPNTHLRRHRDSVRELVGTPAHGLSLPTDSSTWSPAFAIHDDENDDEHNDDDGGCFRTHGNAIFDEITASIFEGYEAYFARGSPMKSSVKRPVLQRSATTARVLADVAGARVNIRLASPIRMAPPKRPSASLESPIKKGKMQGVSPPTPKACGLETDELVDFGSDDDAEDDQVLDIAMGFKDIGEEKENAPEQGKQKFERPALGRSLTNVF